MFNSSHCLPALQASLSEFSSVIFVGNGSDDQSAEQAQSALPRAQVIALPQNLGFGTANNRALQGVSTPFALLLNPDCEISPEAVKRLVNTAQQFPQAAVVAPQLLKANGLTDINYRWPNLLWKSQGPGVADGPACVGFVCGAAMLQRMEAFADTGFFDERFFLYYEDDDLSMRLFQAQRPMIIDPQATALHRSRGSVRGNKPPTSEYLRGFHHVQSKLTFASKYKGLPAARRLQRRTALTASVALVLRLLLPSPRLVARMYGRWRGLHAWAPQAS